MSRFRKLEYPTLLETIETSSQDSAIYVGCDSKLTGPYTLFGLVVVLHIEGHKGGMVYGQKSLVNRRMAINERLLREVDIAMESAFTICGSVDRRVMEVHLDINPNPEHKSNGVMKRAVSYVQAQGFEYKIKPSAWAASTAADYLIN
ncbi:MAG: hypothetical protein GY754_04000 [bacterium]|nr:hypothetical protein [bacterium]